METDNPFGVISNADIYLYGLAVKHFGNVGVI